MTDGRICGSALGGGGRSRSSGQCVALLGVAYRGDVKETAFTSARLLRARCRRAGPVSCRRSALFGGRAGAVGLHATRRRSAGRRWSLLVVQAAHSPIGQLDLGVFTGCRALLDGRRALERAAVERAGMRYLVIGDGGLCADEAPADRRHGDWAPTAAMPSLPARRAALIKPRAADRDRARPAAPIPEGGERRNASDLSSAPVGRAAWYHPGQVGTGTIDRTRRGQESREGMKRQARDWDLQRRRQRCVATSG